MMKLVTFLVILATAINGLLSGLNVDTALVKLPARRRIGAVAYATFARGNDLGNGLVLYPLLGVGAAILTLLATALAYAECSPKDIPDDEAILMAKLDRFARWHAVRATFQVLTFCVLLWALVVS